MNKLKTEVQKAELLDEMNRERARFVAGQGQRQHQVRQMRGVSSVEGALLNSLFTFAVGGRVPALLRKPVQAFALSWLKSRFDGLVARSQARPAGSGKMLFQVGSAKPVALGEAPVPEPVHVEAVNDLRHASNALNLAIEQNRHDDVERLAETLRQQIVVTRDVLATAASLPDTPVDKAFSWMAANARTRPWAAVGAGAGLGYVAGLGLAIWRRVQSRRQARRELVLNRELAAMRAQRPVRRYY